MPQINLIPVPLYDPMHPYHWEYDNLPLNNLIDRQGLINSAVDINTDILRGTAGNQGSLSNRLNQSIDEDGSLKSTAIDDAGHNIGAHMDGEYSGTSYVRMLLTERDKLDLVADEATNLSVQIETPSAVVLFDDGIVNFEPSTGIEWQVISPNKIRANLTFATSAIHQHYYNREPVDKNTITPDHINYKVNSVGTPFINGSLRVVINGVEINDTVEVYVPGDLLTDPWQLIKYTPDATNGEFSLSTAITSDDVIRIHYDIELTT